MITAVSPGHAVCGPCQPVLSPLLSTIVLEVTSLPGVSECLKLGLPPDLGTSSNILRDARQAINRRRRTVDAFSPANGDLAKPGYVPVGFRFARSKLHLHTGNDALFGDNAKVHYLQRGFKHPLQSEDVPSLHSRYGARGITASVQATFRTCHADAQKNPLWCALYEAFRKEFWLCGLCRGTADCLLALVPFISRFLIQFVIDSYIAHLQAETGPPLRHGIGYLAGMVSMLAIQSLAHNHYMYLMSVMGGRTRAILVSAIFERSANVRDSRDGSQDLEIEGQNQKKGTALEKQGRCHLSGHVINLVTVQSHHCLHDHGSSNQHDCHRAQHECGRVHDGLVHLPARYSFRSSFHWPALKSLWSSAYPACLEHLVLDLEHCVWFRESEGHSHHSKTFRWVWRERCIRFGRWSSRRCMEAGAEGKVTRHVLAHSSPWCCCWYVSLDLTERTNNSTVLPGPIIGGFMAQRTTWRW